MERDDFNASPTEHTLQFLIQAEGRFRQPLLVEAKQTQSGKWRVHETHLSIEGLSETPTAALKDFEAALIYHFNELTRTQRHLDAQRLRELHFIRTIITE